MPKRVDDVVILFVGLREADDARSPADDARKDVEQRVVLTRETTPRSTTSGGRGGMGAVWKGEGKKGEEGGWEKRKRGG